MVRELIDFKEIEMKKINYISFLAVLALLITSCTSDPFVDESILVAAQEANAFVRFDNALDDVLNVSEADGPQELTLEFLNSGVKDVTAEFTFSGSAEYGVDYSVEGASAAGGSITLFHDASSDQITQTDLVVDILTDGLTDGDKTLVVTLSGATASDGSAIDAGQGDLYKSITINIGDADCTSALAGTYTYTGTGFLDGATGTVEIADLEGNGNYTISDFAGLAFGDPTPYEFSVACGVVAAPAASEVSAGVAATITGTADEVTKAIELSVTLNCCGGEGLAWTLSLTPA